MHEHGSAARPRSPASLDAPAAHRPAPPVDPAETRGAADGRRRAG
ncbi:hypothetical protein POF73_12615 [Streptomyces sp. HD]|nr:hypothetical protein [Streptomyces sp. HD]